MVTGSSPGAATSNVISPTQPPARSRQKYVGKSFFTAIQVIDGGGRKATTLRRARTRSRRSTPRGASETLPPACFDAQTRCPYSTNPTSAANAFRLTRHNCANDDSRWNLARRSAGTESPLRAAGPQQGTGTSRAPARASIGISDPTDSSGRSAIPTTAVTEPTAAARSLTHSAAASAGPPDGPAAGSVRPATKAAGAGHRPADHSAAAEGGTGAKPTPLAGQPAVDGSGPGHRAGGRPGRGGRC